MQANPKRIQHYQRSILIGALMGLSLAVMFAAGFFFRGMVDIKPALASADSQSGYPLLDEVQNLLDQHYLRPQPEYNQRQYAAVRGLLNALNDRYTFLIDPPVARSESDVLAGTYGGIGVQIQRSESGDVLLYPFTDGPATAKGIQEGDILKAINGTVVDLTMQQDAIDQMLRGEVKEGNGVEITVTKANSDEEFTVFIPFAVINVPSVIWRIVSEDTHIGYIQIIRFTSRTPEELKTGIEQLRSQEVKGLILDLRNNAGGLLQESIAVATQFLDGGVIVYEKSNRDEESVNAATGGLATDLPLVVLVNQGTASAAELVAGAIQDHERGVLIGQTTYGKGTVQQIFRLSDESSLHITSAEWLTPNKNHLDGVGLQPNIAMIPDPNGRDVELGEAVRTLEKTLKAQD